MLERRKERRAGRRCHSREEGNATEVSLLLREMIEMVSNGKPNGNAEKRFYDRT